MPRLADKTLYVLFQKHPSNLFHGTKQSALCDCALGLELGGPNAVLLWCHPP